MKKFKKLNLLGFGHIEGFVFVLVVAAIALGGIYVSKHHQSHASSYTTVASSTNNSSTIEACQTLVDNVYHANILYTKPASASGFYGLTVVDGKTSTNRNSKTGSTYTASTSAQLTTNASLSSSDHISVFEVVNGKIVSNTDVNPATLGSCSNTTAMITNNSLPNAAARTSTNEAAAANAARHLRTNKTNPGRPKVNGKASTAAYPSTVWSGYAATPNNGGSFNTTIGYMVVPTVTCTSSQAYDEVLAWTGFDGWVINGNNDGNVVEQDGIGAICDPYNPGDAPDYEAWWEMYPNAINTFMPNGNYFLVKPGDVIQMEVATYYGYAMIVKDLTTGESASTVQQCTYKAQYGGCPRQTAEWIVELPTNVVNGNGQLPKFSTTSFAFDQANDGLGNQVISQFPNTPINIVSPSTLNPMASVGPLTVGGSGFNVTWQASN